MYFGGNTGLPARIYPICKLLFFVIFIFVLLRLVSSAEATTYHLSGRVNVQVAFDCSTMTEIPQVECEALVSLYNSTDGTNWFNSTDWLATNTPCSGFGIICLPSGIVWEVDLEGNNLTGYIPTKLGNLPSLDALLLS